VAEDVQLDLADRGRLTEKDVGVYFAHYSKNPEYQALLLAHTIGLWLMIPSSP
jgi:hypothetical protein